MDVIKTVSIWHYICVADSKEKVHICLKVVSSLFLKFESFLK